jgi:oligoribonuclease (3'-5' exoribonuclease)
MDLILNVMNDFQTVNDIVNESVRNSSYYTVAISSCVFILYTLIVQLIGYFKGKAKNKPLIEMAEAIKENTENIVKLNSVLDKTLQGAEKKKVRQCESAIDLAFKASSLRIVQEAASIIAHNNIDKNKEFIVSNINKFVSTEYYRLYSALAIYEINDVNVASRLKEEWIKEIADNIVDIIYNGQDAMTRVTQINNRLNVCINEYSTYINNKTFNT